MIEVASDTVQRSQPGCQAQAASLVSADQSAGENAPVSACQLPEEIPGKQMTSRVLHAPMTRRKSN
jgi:hypothetical protein